MGLGEDIIECQNDESYDDCTTREYTNDLLTECKCLPFNTGQKEKEGQGYRNKNQKLSKNF